MALDWTRAAELAAAGATCPEIAAAIGRNRVTVFQWARRVGLALAPGKPGPKPNTTQSERSIAMCAMYQQGLTLQKIADQYGVTRERVRQVVSKAGQARAGVRMRQRVAAAKSATADRAFASRIDQKWGVELDLWRELRASGVIGAFETQRQNSKRRGIAWGLTFAEWYSIWQASGKLHLRGKGIGRYCMSRIKDEGGYELGNVHVQLSTKNSQDAVAKWRGKEKAIRGVFCLYPGRELAWLAKYGKKPLGYFATAEEAGAAREAYMTANNISSAPVLGRGRGWTLVKNASKPYLMQCCGESKGFATQAEAEAAYAEVSARKLAARRAEAVTRLVLPLAPNTGATHAP